MDISSLCRFFLINSVKLISILWEFREICILCFFSFQNDDLKALFYAAFMPSFRLYFNLLVGCHVIRLYFSNFLCKGSTISQ